MSAEDSLQEEATQALKALASGENAAERLLQLVYPELRALASAQLRQERADHTLQPTALVHEAWLKLIDQSQVEWAATPTKRRRGSLRWSASSMPSMRRRWASGCWRAASSRRAIPGTRWRRSRRTERSWGSG